MDNTFKQRSFIHSVRFLCILTFTLLANPLNLEAQDKVVLLDSFFTDLYNRDQFNGNVLIAEKGQVIYKKSFGLAELSKNEKLDSQSIFELASVTKQFTAMGIMLLHKQGKLQYDDSLQKYFPQLPYDSVTIRHLLNHTSGLPDYMTLFASNWDSNNIAVNKDVINLLSVHKPKKLFSPGEKFDYSNTGYVLLASIIEKVSGKSFGQFLHDHIFEPLGMKNTLAFSRRHEKRSLKNYAFGYVQNKKNQMVLPDSIPEYRPLVYCLDGIKGDGTISSTVEDLFLWDRVLYTEKLLLKDEFAEALKIPVLANGNKTSYGFGWIVDSSSNYGWIMSHTGGWPGYSTLMERHFQHDKTIIILQNVENQPVDYRKIRKILYGIKEDASLNKKLPVDSLMQYEGDYALSPEFSIKIKVNKDVLTGQGSGQPSFDMTHTEKDMFSIIVVDAKIRFNRNEDGKVVSLTLFQGGEEVIGLKSE